MKGRVILLDRAEGQPAKAALLVDGQLEDVLIDPPVDDTTPRPGEIYRARLDRLVPNMGGGFVKLTAQHQGFLREAKGMKQGASLLVQVTGYAEPGKAVPVSSRVLYKGRRLIHTPLAPGINVSRQIRDADERARLTQIIAAWKPAGDGPEAASLEDCHTAGGTILRSAAAGADAGELEAELGHLYARRVALEQSDRDLGNGAGCIDQALREWTTGGDMAIWLGAGAELRREIAPFASADLTDALHHDTSGDLFDAFGLHEELASLLRPDVTLPGGGSICVEATRAMVTVDVNTGGGFSGGAAMTANIEAARALARQLRLRGLGGQIVVDFAPLKKMHRKKIEETLKAAFRADPVETSQAGWTPLGHFELLRKRERRPLAELLSQA